MNISRTTRVVKPIAFAHACLLAVPGALIGQMIGLLAPISYTVFFTIGGALTAGLIGYGLNSHLKTNRHNFFKSLAMALAVVFGAIWGGTTLGPAMFFFGITMLGTSSALLAGLLIGAVGSVLVSLTAVLINGHRSNLWLVNTFSFGLIGLILFGCAGLMWGPVGWMLSLTSGAILGLGVGIINSIFNKSSDSAKFFASIYSISGALIGVMLGAVVSSIVPIIPSTLISTFLGVSFTLGGVVLGTTIGRQYQEIDLDDDSFRHKVYQAVIFLPILFLSYLAGGVFGFIYLPATERLLSQAVGMIMGASTYGSITATYYTVKELLKNNIQASNSLNLQSQNSIKSSNLTQLSPSAKLEASSQFDKDNVVKEAITTNPYRVKSLLVRLAPELFQSSVQQSSNSHQEEQTFSNELGSVSQPAR